MLHRMLANQAAALSVSLMEPKKGTIPYSDVVETYNSASGIGKVMLRIQRKRVVASILPRRRRTDVEEIASKTRAVAAI
jgi:hypothetical protein